MILKYLLIIEIMKKNKIKQTTKNKLSPDGFSFYKDYEKKISIYIHSLETFGMRRNKYQKKKHFQL
jgi:AICAR transformylase/IMP cyclohydrolase PurH